MEKYLIVNYETVTVLINLRLLKRVKLWIRDKAFISGKICLMWSVTIVYCYTSHTMSSQTVSEGINKCFYNKASSSKYTVFNYWRVLGRRGGGGSYAAQWFFLDHPKHVQLDWGVKTSKVNSYGKYNFLSENHEQYALCVASYYRS